MEPNNDEPRWLHPVHDHDDDEPPAGMRVIWALLAAAGSVIICATIYRKLMTGEWNDIAIGAALMAPALLSTMWRSR